MPNHCCVPGCGATKNVHKFPTNPDVRDKWISALAKLRNHDWQPSKSSVVCRYHFLSTDIKQDHSYGSRRSAMLKPDAVPSQFSTPPKAAKSVTEDITEDITRSNKRSLLAVNFNENPAKRHAPATPDVSIPPISTSTPARPGAVSTSNWTLLDDMDTPNVSCVEEVAPLLYSDQPSSPRDQESPCSLFSTSGTQCTDRETAYSITRFMHQPNTIQYYTGLDNYDHFMLLFRILGPAVHELSYQCKLLSPEDQLFLTLMKLRQAKDDQELAIMFEIGTTTVSAIVTTWINFMYHQLGELDIWPDRDVIDDTMPQHFKQVFPTTRVIVDATEVPIAKPSNVNNQSATFSTYKNRNTLKTLIGVTPRGLVSFISPSYGGCCSDRQICERSSLMENSRWQTKDSIMADRGFLVQDLFSSKGVKVNIPTFLKGKSQLEPETVVGDRRIASKRIHVERVIGLGKTYKALTTELHPKKVPQGGRIIAVCYMLSNFRRSIVNRLA